MAIEVKNLTHVYMPGTPFEKKALDDVSLRINDGDFIGLIGHTGSGKSTLVMHLNGLLKTEEGSITVDGMKLGDKDTKLRDVCRRVGLVFQYPEYQLFEETVLKDVMFGALNAGMSEAEAKENSRQALLDVGIGEELFERSPFELSGGQKRRVAIAGVLSMRPSTIILDEPTAGLDPRGREEIMSLIKKIHESGSTVIMVSHSMTDVSRLCTRVLVMDHAKLVLDAPTAVAFENEEILRNARLDLPPCASLASKLRKLGYSIPKNAYTLETVAEAIKLNLKGGC